MKKLKIILIVIISIFAVGVVGLFLMGYFAPKPGGLRIETSPKASVFVNGELNGTTPFEGSFPAGKILLRLVPEGSSENLISYETSVNLEEGTETVIGRNFRTSEDESSGYVVSFEKSAAKTASLTAISLPDASQVVIDGVSRGFSPYNISAISPGMHTVTIKSPGYTDFTMTVKTVVGFRLTFYVKLGLASQNSFIKNDSVNQKTVTILDTPEGYVKVKAAPGDNNEYIAQVKSGETYPYVDTDVETGEVEIQYQAPKSGMPSGLTGWIPGNLASVSALIK